MLTDASKKRTLDELYFLTKSTFFWSGISIIICLLKGWPNERLPLYIYFAYLLLTLRKSWDMFLKRKNVEWSKCSTLLALESVKKVIQQMNTEKSSKKHLCFLRKRSHKSKIINWSIKTTCLIRDLIRTERYMIDKKLVAKLR